MKNYASLRRLGRLFLCLILALLPFVHADAAGPATTTVADTVYRADGSPAAGTLVIAWNAFTTADGKAVPAGRKTVKIGGEGAVSIALAPNYGATPEGSYYKVTYQLDDGSSSEEYWSVPAAPTTTISAIRSKLVPANVAVQYATRQYVDTMLAQGGGGGSGNAVQLQGVDIEAVQPARGQSLVFDGAKYTPYSQPVVDVARDGGATPDATGTSYNPAKDSHAALQAVIDANPGRIISFSTMAVPVAGSITKCSYSVSKPLVLKGQQVLMGDTGGRQGGTVLCFPAGVTGIVIINGVGGGTDYYAQHAQLRNLDLRGGDAYDGTSNFVIPSTRATSGTGKNSDGVRNSGNGTFIANVSVAGFARTGIKTDGTLDWDILTATRSGATVTLTTPITPDWTNGSTLVLSGFIPASFNGNCTGSATTGTTTTCTLAGADAAATTAGVGAIPGNQNANEWNYIHVEAFNNRGDGFWMRGGDANAGTCVKCDARSNQFFGIREESFLGNAYSGGHTEGNHQDGTETAAQKSIIAISRAANVVTVQTSAAHGYSSGNWVHVGGTSGGGTTCGFDCSFEGWYQITVTAADTFTYAQTGANSAPALTGAPKVRLAGTGAAIWGAAGVANGAGGPYECTGASNQSWFFGIYAEAAQGKSQIDYRCQVRDLNSGDGYARTAINYPNLSAPAETAVASTDTSGGLFTGIQRLFAVNPNTGLTQTQGFSVGGFSTEVGALSLLDTTANPNVNGALWFGKNTGAGCSIDSMWGIKGGQTGTFSDCLNFPILFADGTTNPFSLGTYSTTGLLRPWMPPGFYMGNYTAGSGPRLFYLRNSVPTSGAYRQGDTLFCNPNTCSGYLGWIATAAGAPGTWRAFGLVANDATGTSWTIPTLNVTTLAVGSSTPVANLTLASDSQLPTIAQSKVTNLAADLAARVQLAGDLGGSAAQPTVSKIQGRNVATTAPGDGDCYKWVAAASQWQPAACAGGDGGAPSGYKYLGLAADAGLTAEQVFTPGTGLARKNGESDGNGTAYTLESNYTDPAIAGFADEWCAGVNGDLGWQQGAGGGNLAVGTSVWGHPCTVEFRSGATSGNWIGSWLGTASGGTPSLVGLWANTNWDSTIKFRRASAAVTNERIYVGFAQRAAPPPNQGCWLRFDSVRGDTNFMFECQNGSQGNSTAVDTGVPADTAWHKLRIRSLTAGVVLFTLDGGTERSISTNLPSSDGSPALVVATNEASQKVLVIDRFAWFAKGL